jgi:gluconolactonase
MTASQENVSTVSWRTLTDGLEFPEGPTFDSTGTLFVVETSRGVITAIGTDGNKWMHATPGGGPNGLVIGADSALYVANNGGISWDGKHADTNSGTGSGRIERIDNGGEVTVLYERAGADPLDGPNDITVGPDGWLWFTDPGHGDIKEPRGRVYAAAPDGSSIVLVADKYQFSNGLVFTADFSSLIVAETGSGKLFVHRVDGHGLGEREELLRLPRGYKPDGMCLDVEGNILVAGTFGGSVFAYAPDGELLAQMDPGDSLVTNLAFGGPDHDEVFVTVNRTGRVVVFRWCNPGLRLPYVTSVASET